MNTTVCTNSFGGSIRSIRNPIALSIVFLLTGCGAHLQQYEFIQPKMGTGFRIVIYAPSAEIASQASAAAYARIDQLNAVLSDYDPNSELSRLCQRTNAGPMVEPVKVSDDLWNVLDRGIAAARESNGAFDITIGPCVRLWRRSRELQELPTPERLAEAKACVGYQFVRLNAADHSVQLLHEKMRLDVGGIAKGYTSDQCLALLRERGLSHSLVGAAGDIAAGDPPPGKKKWRIAIRSLGDAEQASEYIHLANYAVSTSGDTERFVIIDGRRYSHIVDPRTGLGLTRRIGVTVIAPRGINADWMTKPPSILGPEAGLALIESTPGVAARIVTIDDAGKRTVHESRHFREFLEAAGSD